MALTLRQSALVIQKTVSTARLANSVHTSVKSAGSVKQALAKAIIDTQGKIEKLMDFDKIIKDLEKAAEDLSVMDGDAAKAKAADTPDTNNIPVTCATSQMMCVFGAGPSTYVSIRAMTLINKKPAANITDSILGVNIQPFPLCISPTHPLWQWSKPFAPCTPVAGPFVPTNPTTLIENAPINTLNNITTCSVGGGTIKFINPSQFTTFTN